MLPVNNCGVRAAVRVCVVCAMATPSKAKYYEQEYKTYKQKWDAAGKLQEVTEAKVRLKDEELNEAYAKVSSIVLNCAHLN